MHVLSISTVVNIFDFLYLFFMLVKGIKDSIWILINPILITYNFMSHDMFSRSHPHGCLKI